MSIAIDYVSLMHDKFRGEMLWQDIVGIHAASLNVQLSAFGDSLPRSIDVEVRSREPNQPHQKARAAKATLGIQKVLSAQFVSQVVGDTKRGVYRVSSPIDQLGSFLTVGSAAVHKVATVARRGGTSDSYFRTPGHAKWAFRGVGRQPDVPGVQTGNRESEAPDAFRLFQAGGVELLEVGVVSQPNWKLSPPARHLIRSPANVLYYSGHGLNSGHLAVKTASGNYERWLGPEDLKRSWRRNLDLDVVILAGCHVLELGIQTIIPNVKFAQGPGYAWADLLMRKSGPLLAILGYAGYSEAKAPSDEQAGNLIAARMAARIAGGSREFVKDWLQANWEHKAVGGINAVGMNHRGYWRLNPKNGDIQGPEAI